jgi:hypothetical protein
MPTVSIDKLVNELNRVNTRRDELIAQINSAIANATKGTAGVRRKKGKKRTMSAEAKKRIAAAARKRWAKYRAEQAGKK